MDVSKKLNNDLGSLIEAPFSNLLPIAILRHQLAIEGRARSIPPIVWRLRSDIGEPVEMEIAHDGTITYSFENVVIREDHEKFKRLLLGGSEEQVREMLKGVLKKCRSRQENLYSEDGVAIESVDDYLKAANAEAATLLGGDIKLFDTEVWMKGLAKITLSLGHLVLGSDWTFSPDGDRYRVIISSGRRQWPIATMGGFAAGQLPEKIRKMLGINKQVQERKCHTLAFLPTDSGQRQFAALSLFGGNDVPEALISVGSARGRLVPINDTMQANSVVGYRIDPRTRKSEKITIADLDRNSR